MQTLHTVNTRVSFCGQFVETWREVLYPTACTWVYAGIGHVGTYVCRCVISNVNWLWVVVLRNACLNVSVVHPKKSAGMYVLHKPLFAKVQMCNFAFWLWGTPGAEASIFYSRLGTKFEPEGPKFTSRGQSSPPGSISQWRKLVSVLLCSRTPEFPVDNGAAVALGKIKKSKRSKNPKIRAT
jgi:hypothetical protein